MSDRSTLLNVVVLFGGRSGEHDVSRSSAAYIIDTLRGNERFYLLPVGITRDGAWFSYEGDTAAMRDGTWLDHGPVYPATLVPDTRRPFLHIQRSGKIEHAHVDVVFPVLHGPYGEDGTLQGMLELADLPFVGCGMTASAVAMDKIMANTIFDGHDIPHTPWYPIDELTWHRDAAAMLDDIADTLLFPVFVKPARAGSSLGITRVASKATLAEAIEHALRFDRKAVVEQGVRGRELEIAAIGGYQWPTLSCAGEIVPDREFYDYDSKYEDDSTSQLIIPAKLSPEERASLEWWATRVWAVLDLYGMARIDFFLSDDGQLFVNEVNTIPGFVNISMYPRLLRASGHADDAVLEELIELALERERP
ncbi:MAG: D-alanine--D-alanine ligase family protein [Saccharofermentanales bacterium]|jgi:D-alanine-D-alanine ligase